MRKYAYCAGSDLLIGIVDMEAVKQPVCRRSQDDTDIGNECHPAEKSVGRGEQFAGSISDLYHRPHAAEDHGGIVQGIYPVDVGTIVIPQNTNKQTYEQNDHCYEYASEDAGQKNCPRGYGFIFIFIHIGIRLLIAAKLG